MSTSDPIASLRQQVYLQRLEVEHLRREVFGLPAAQLTDVLFEELQVAELALAQAESQLGDAQRADPNSGLLVSLQKGGGPVRVLGAQTTGLSAQVHLRMAQVPTAIYHLLDAEKNPLITCQVTNHSNQTRRLRVKSYIDGYSAEAVSSTEVDTNNQATIHHLPTLFLEMVGELTELSRATLNILVEDLDNGKVESHTTHPIWLLARTTAPLAVRDPQTGGFQDLTPYLGAFVTPNAPSLMAFLRQAADLHPQQRLVGYQGDASAVEPQVQAIFEALKSLGNITYVNSVISFSPDQGVATQRVRLPRESLEHHEANCIDGTVLFASLLEAISLHPAIVLVPGHAFLAWETWRDSGQWAYLETTMIGSHPFDEARNAGEANAARYQALAQQNPGAFVLLPLRYLRAELGILPME